MVPFWKWVMAGCAEGCTWLGVGRVAASRARSSHRRRPTSIRACPTYVAQPTVAPLRTRGLSRSAAAWMDSRGSGSSGALAWREPRRAAPLRAPPPGADACMTAMPGHSHLVARRAARAGPSSIWPFIGELATGAHVHTGQIDLRSVVWRGWGAPGRAGTPASGGRSPNRCRITLDFQANHRWGRRSPSARPP